MKLLFFLFTIFICSSLQAQTDSVLVNTTYREYIVHVPPSYVPGTPMPLVIAMHGFTGAGWQLQIQSQLSVKADASGFIVVYPDGLGGIFSSWNAGACCSYAVNNSIDDIGFISTLLDTLEADYSIDTDRVYATGHSNGAMMCYRLACEMSNRIAAIAPVAGVYQVVGACSPTRRMPVIHFHSYLDINVPVLGGNGSTIPYLYFPPADSSLTVFANEGNCSVSQDTLYDGLDYDRFQWSDCDCNYTNELYITHDGGHSWPGGNTTAGGGNPASTVINANDLMWDFFQLHTLDCPTNEIEEGELSELKIYPNPSSGEIIIDNLDDSSEIILTGLTGKILMSTTINKLDVSHLPSGVYTLTILTTVQSKSFKIIKE